MTTEYYRWTTHSLHNLLLGHGIWGVCNDEWHERCLADPRGCTSILSMGWGCFPGNTEEEKRANRAKQAKEAQATCRRVKVTIEEV